MTETRKFCDRCVEELRRDAGVFVGSSISIRTTTPYEYQGIEGCEAAKDLCPQCAKELHIWLSTNEVKQ